MNTTLLDHKKIFTYMKHAFEIIHLLSLQLVNVDYFQIITISHITVSQEITMNKRFNVTGLSIFHLDFFTWICLLGFFYLDLSRCLLYNLYSYSGSNRMAVPTVTIDRAHNSLCYGGIKNLSSFIN